MTELEVKLIKLDGGTQARAGTDRDTVNEYVEALRESDSTWPFPAVVVYHDGDAYWLADGFHRITAARQHGRFVCEADIRQGTQRDAILHAAGANAEHGLRRTPEDKRRAVLRLLEDAEWGRWSDREIARTCKVSHPFVAKVRTETGNVTSERVYVRNGEERVMDTAAIGGKPRPSIDDMRKRLRQSLRDEMYATYQVTGITDADLRQVLGRDWGLGGGSSGPDRTAVYRKGGANPGFWYNNYRDSGKPTLSGKELIGLVRELLELPYPQKETAVSQPAPSPFYVGPMAQGPEVREALGRYLDQWPANRDFIIMRLANVEASGHEKEMADAVAALGASDAAIYHQAMVLRNNLPGPSWEREKRAVETAVSTARPLTQQIIADVEAGYEKEWETAVPTPVIPARAAHVDPRLTSLNDAIGVVTRLTGDTSLTIDIVGPLARALGFLEDAKRALAKRQDYINWLRDYQDDDGRRWTDLSDSQTWHKNSPCYQAFVKAFPREDFVKSALMDAKQQLERETAVAEEPTE